MQCVAVCCSVLQCVAVCCRVMWRVAVLQAHYASGSASFSYQCECVYNHSHMYTLQWIAVSCSVLQFAECVMPWPLRASPVHVHMCINIRIEILQCVTLCCSVLHCVAVCWAHRMRHPSTCASFSCKYACAYKKFAYKHFAHSYTDVYSYSFTNVVSNTYCCPTRMIFAWNFVHNCYINNPAQVFCIRVF